MEGLRRSSTSTRQIFYKPFSDPRFPPFCPCYSLKQGTPGPWLTTLRQGPGSPARRHRSGHGTLERSDQHLRYSNRHGLAVGDFNGDGYPDIFAGAYAEDYTVWFNQGNGTFQGQPPTRSGRPLTAGRAGLKIQASLGWQRAKDNIP